MYHVDRESPRNCGGSVLFIPAYVTATVRRSGCRWWCFQNGRFSVPFAVPDLELSPCQVWELVLVPSLDVWGAHSFEQSLPHVPYHVYVLYLTTCKPYPFERNPRPSANCAFCNEWPYIDVSCKRTNGKPLFIAMAFFVFISWLRDGLWNL